MKFELEEHTVDLFVRGNPKNHSYAKRKIKAELERQLEEPKDEVFDFEYPISVTDYHRFKADVFRKERIIAEIHFRDDLDTELPDQNFVKGAIVAVDSQKIRIEPLDAGIGAFDLPYTHIYDIAACKSVEKDMEAWRRDFVPSPVPKEALPSMEEAMKLPEGCGSPAEVHSGEDAVLEPKEERREGESVASMNRRLAQEGFETRYEGGHDRPPDGGTAIDIPPNDEPDEPTPVGMPRGANVSPAAGILPEMAQQMPQIPSFDAERAKQERDQMFAEVTRLQTVIEIWAKGNDHSPESLFDMLDLEYEEIPEDPEEKQKRYLREKGWEEVAEGTWRHEVFNNSYDTELAYKLSYAKPIVSNPERELEDDPVCQCWNEGQWGRVHREDCPIHGPERNPASEPNSAPEREQSEREGSKSEDVVEKIKGVLLGDPPYDNLKTVVGRITDLVFEGRLRR